MRTTVTLDDELGARLESEVRATGKGFEQVLNDALRAGLARRRQPAASAPFVVVARPLGLVPGLDYSDVGALLGVAEGPAHP